MLSDPAGGPPWHFGFSEMPFKPRCIWYKIEKGARLELDPLRGWNLKAEIQEPPADRKPGSSVTIQPWLFTRDDLLINYGYRGAPTARAATISTTAHVTLLSTAGTILDAMTSGFS